MTIKRSWARRLPCLSAVMFLALFGGCKAETVVADLARNSAQPQGLELAQGRGGWRLDGSNPIIRAGDFRNQGLWNDPDVLKINGRYVMYLTSSTEAPFKPPVLPFRAVSNDGVRWRLNPNRPLLTPAGTPFVSIETPSVVYFKGRYHMYYTGDMPAGQVPPMAIGHAVSDDGVHWRNDSRPVIQATGRPAEWDGYLVGEPGAVVYRGRIYVYFSAVGARKGGSPPQLQSIGLAISDDGQHFSRSVPVLRQSSLYPARDGYVGYSTPSAFVLDGMVHLVYDVAHYAAHRNPQWQQVALHHAVSPDGEHNFVQDTRPLFTKRDFSWTTGEISAPTALVDNGELKLWFAGHVAIPQLAPMIRRGWKGPEFGIGYATMPLGQFLNSR